jgi:hypothetical protein
MSTTIARSLFALALTVWVGAVVFWSLVALPVLFSNLATARAGEVAALVFPPYYLLGTASGALLVAASVFLAFRVGRPWRYATMLGAVMLVCQAYAAYVVHPRAAAVRGSDEHRVEFDVLHKRAVWLNAVVLGGGLILVLASGSILARR